MMPIFNLVQDPDQSDTYTKIEIQWKKFKLLSGHHALMTEHPGSLREA